MSNIKTIYLRCRYETGLFEGDFSNGVFYDGMIKLPDSKVDNFIKDFKNKRKFKMHPHSSKGCWSEPFFDENDVKEFDLSNCCLLLMRPSTKTMLVKDEGRKGLCHYKYYYWLEIKDDDIEI